MSIPTIVSFFAGARYYHDSAERLRQDCDRLGLRHDICELEKPAHLDWADVCRQKIPFYRRKLAEHPQGILWVDVDTRILRRPDFTALGGFDIAAFPSRFRSFADYDPALTARRLHPGFVLFAGTERALDFATHLAEVESQSPAKATDDHFLEEGLRHFGKGLGVYLFNADRVAFDEDEARRNPEVCFLFGSSGNVSAHIQKVEQHSAAFFDDRRERAVLMKHFRLAAKRGLRSDAEALVRSALRIDETDGDTALAAAEFSVRIGKPRQALQQLRAAFDMRTAPPQAQAIATEACLASSDLAGAGLALRRLGRSAAHAAFKRSREFRLDLEIRADELGLKPEDRPALWWMEQPYPGNFGDVLNPYVVEKLSGLPPRYVPKGDGILAIGSVIKFAKAGTKVWGTGTPRMTDKLSPDADYRAVRGPLTRKLVIDSGGTAPELYGDAAMLLPLMKSMAPKKHRLGLIRHYTHADEPMELKGDTIEIGISRIGYDDIEAFIDELTSCEAIISTSLHGLIVAHAYGIPTRRAVFSGSEREIPGDGTKFADHYSAFGIDLPEALDLSGIATVSDALATACIERVTLPVRYRALLDAAPFPVLPEMLDRADALETAVRSSGHRDGIAAFAGRQR